MSHKTDFMQKRGYGVFFHYISGVQNNPSRANSLGLSTDWETCVQALNVERLADQVASTGAGWLGFTILQQTRFMIAPNATFDRATGYKPGEACSTRDLIAELSDALEKRGVKLFLYFTGDGPFRDEKAAKALGNEYPSQIVNDTYFDNWLPVLEEYSKTYGKRISGWWLDGCYPGIGYNEERCRRISDVARAGNPDAVVAMNYYGCGTNMYEDKTGTIRADWYLNPTPPMPGDDYTAGEVNLFGGLPVERFMDGAQWHILGFLGRPPVTKMIYDGWGTPGMRYDKNWLLEYVKAIREAGGVITFDAALYRDGTMDAEQLQFLRMLAQLPDNA